MSKATSIVRMESFRNRTPRGRASATAARKLAMYIGYGRGRQQEQEQRPLRGLWHDEKGNILRHQEVLTWVVEQAKSQEHTYQFILSAKFASLDEEEYTKALQAGGNLFPTWRLMRHEDASYAHAHVLAFGDKEIRIKDPVFQEWCHQVRMALEQMQDQYLNRQQEQQTEMQPEQHLEMQQEQQMEVRLAEERSLHRGWGMGWGMEM
ncbi:MAG: hypothetical protein KJ069_32125 [Anaerolineae bacterium]|nr:hypothetical protein [Anaerolineae bacterium]